MNPHFLLPSEINLINIMISTLSNHMPGCEFLITNLHQFEWRGQTRDVMVI